MIDMSRMPTIESNPVFGFIPQAPSDLKFVTDFMFDRDTCNQHRLQLCDSSNDPNFHLIVTDMYCNYGHEFRLGKPIKLYSMERGFDLATSTACLVTHYFAMEYKFGPDLRLNITQHGPVLTDLELQYCFLHTRVHFQTSLDDKIEVKNPYGQSVWLDDEIPF